MKIISLMIIVTIIIATCSIFQKYCRCLSLDGESVAYWASNKFKYDALRVPVSCVASRSGTGKIALLVCTLPQAFPQHYGISGTERMAVEASNVTFTGNCSATTKDVIRQVVSSIYCIKHNIFCCLSNNY